MRKTKAMNYKLQLHKERLETMLNLLKLHDRYEEMFDFDPEAIKGHEIRTRIEYAAELAALLQLSFKQIQNSAKPLGTIVIKEDGTAVALTQEETDLLTQQLLS